jgi:hypothetical protein
MMWWSLSILSMVTPRLWCRWIAPPWADHPSKERESEAEK